MFQGDPTVRGNSNLDDLGMEARSILKSIQTETNKLEQSSLVARSDLHYFRARFNYYRLSLMRLMPAERELLQPVLSHFMDLIAAREAGEDVRTDGIATKPKEEPATPFLESVSSQGPNTGLSSSPQRVVDYRTAASNEDLVSELTVLKMALQAEASSQGNRHIAKALEKIIDRLSK